MDKTVLAVRATASEYAKRWLWLPLAIGVVIYLVIVGIIWWVAAVASPWWWLLAIIPTFLFLIALTVWIIARVVTHRIAPPMNKAQKSAAKAFVQKIDKAAERVGTPKFVMLYRIIKDVIVRPTSNQTFIGEIAQESNDMRRAFDELRTSF